MAKYAMVVKENIAVRFTKNVILNTLAGETFEILGEIQESHTDYWVVRCQVGYRGSTKPNLSPFCIQKSDTVVIFGSENIDKERMKLFAELTRLDITAETRVGEKTIIKCYLCENPQEIVVLDDMKLKNITQYPHTSYKKIKKFKWKYVCNECISTKDYWQWTRTDAANGHISLDAEAKINIDKEDLI